MKVRETERKDGNRFLSRDESSEYTKLIRVSLLHPNLKDKITVDTVYRFVLVS